MIVSINWLKKFTEIDGSIDELAALVGSRLVEIEEVIDIGKKYNGVIVANVVSCQPHIDSDHLNICKIDDGGAIEGMERDENGHVQVICGAPNVRAGLTVAWLPPGSIVPQTFNDSEPFVLGARKLRGAMSNGMIASARELALFDDHEGIMELDGHIAPGTTLAQAYELDDYLLDIENKSLTHRPDTFGIVGFAREVAAIQGKPFHTPQHLANVNPQWIEKTGNEPTPHITIDDPELSGRYQGVVLTNVNGRVQSPVATQTYLSRIGMRPISAVVDITNYLMMLTGQPLHAFDYDKLKAVNNGTIDIHVRTGRAGETLHLLDGRDIELTPGDIVIANGDTAVALAGAMGGAATEIDEHTTSVFLESATFNLFNLRNTQMRHGIFSEAITRFTKGQPAALTAPVLAEAVALLALQTGASRASDVGDCYPGNAEPQIVYAKAQHLNAALGSQFTTSDIVCTLQNAEFTVEVTDSEVIKVTPPYWRADIHISEDIDEEVGRLNGFDAIVPTLPARDFAAVSAGAYDQLQNNLRAALARAGANEVLTYSFIHGDIITKAGQQPSDSYRITNSISPDLQYYRQSITPSLLNVVHANIKAGFDEFALFELNKVHSKSAGLDEQNVPLEMHRLGLVLARKKAIAGAAYYEAKRLLDYVGSVLGLELTYKPFHEEPQLALARPFEYRRSARVVDAKSGQPIGVIGEYKKTVARNFKLPEYAAGFELLPEGIALAVAQKTVQYHPQSRFPATERDICFQVDSEVLYGQVVAAAQIALSELPYETLVTPLDLYAPPQGATKNITIRIRFVSHEKTLTSGDVAVAIQAITQEVAAATNARIL